MPNCYFVKCLPKLHENERIWAGAGGCPLDPPMILGLFLNKIENFSVCANACASVAVPVNP